MDSDRGSRHNKSKLGDSASKDLLKHNQSINSAMSSRLEVPDFFLYTALNQNQTKDLRKARTNREERKILNQIFNLNAIQKDPGHEVNKVDSLILDFHYVNFDYCVQNQFSNEKLSTLLAVMDFILNTMIKKHLQVEDGVKLLKQIMARHLAQRPPFSIFIFTEQEAEGIQNFMMRTFFRHYSLYEYSFKPKVELVLQTIPKDSLAKQSIDIIDRSPDRDLDISMPHQDANSMVPPLDLAEGEASKGEESPSNYSAAKIESIDWEKVGRIYKPDSAVEHIVSGEMGRLRKALDMQIETQDQANEEKFKTKKK